LWVPSKAADRAPQSRGIVGIKQDRGFSVGKDLTNIRLIRRYYGAAASHVFKQLQWRCVTHGPGLQGDIERANYLRNFMPILDSGELHDFPDTECLGLSRKI
jgi:hypothetical protein